MFNLLSRIKKLEFGNTILLKLIVAVLIKNGFTARETVQILTTEDNEIKEYVKNLMVEVTKHL